MAYKFACPHCGSPLFFADRQESDEDFQEGLCSCRLRFALQQLDVVALELDAEGDGAVARTRRSRYRYSLKALDARGQRVSLQFSGIPIARSQSLLPNAFNFKLRPPTFNLHQLVSRQSACAKAISPNARSSLSHIPPQNEVLTEWSADRLLLLYAVSQGQPQMLTQVRPVTTALGDDSDGLEVASLRWRLWKQRINTGGLAIVTGLGVALPLHSWGNPIHWLLTGLATVAATALAGWGDRFRLRDRQLFRRLNSEQQLLQQQYAMEQKRIFFQKQLQEQQRLLRRLKALIHRMQQADAELYAKRIGVVTRGLATLQESTALTRSLKEGYGQLVNMLVVEYETSRLAEQLPDTSTQEIFQRLGELEVMEERRQKLETLVNPHQLLQVIERTPRFEARSP